MVLAINDVVVGKRRMLCGQKRITFRRPLFVFMLIYGFLMIFEGVCQLIHS